MSPTLVINSSTSFLRVVTPCMAAASTSTCCNGSTTFTLSMCTSGSLPLHASPMPSGTAQQTRVDCTYTCRFLCFVTGMSQLSDQSVKQQRFRSFEEGGGPQHDSKCIVIF